MKVAIVAFVLCFSGWAHAQDWDEDQAELWRFVEESWEDDTGETGKWPDAYVHDNVVSWGPEWPTQRGKESIAKWTRFRDASSEVLEYELFPLAVFVEGDTGVAHYSVVTVRKNSEGKNERSVQGVIETLHRSGGSWKYVSLGGFTIKSGDN